MTFRYLSACKSLEYVYMTKLRKAEHGPQLENGLKPVGIVGKAVGTVAKAVGLASSGNASGKLPPKNKSRLPRKEKKAAKKTINGQIKQERANARRGNDGR